MIVRKIVQPFRHQGLEDRRASPLFPSIDLLAAFQQFSSALLATFFCVAYTQGSALLLACAFRLSFYFHGGGAKRVKMMNRAARATAIDPVSRLRIYINLNPSILSTSKASEATLVFLTMMSLSRVIMK